MFVWFFFYICYNYACVLYVLSCDWQCAYHMRNARKKMQSIDTPYFSFPKEELRVVKGLVTNGSGAD